MAPNRSPEFVSREQQQQFRMNISFGWVLILAGLAGAIPTTLALLRGARTRTRWLRLIVHLLLILLGSLEVQQHRNWQPLKTSPLERSKTTA